MKPLLLLLLLLFTMCCPAQDTVKISLKYKDDFKKIAAVEKYEGLCIFISSLPVSPYTLLGEINILTMGTDYKTTAGALAIKAKKKFADADAIIVTEISGDFCHAQAIKFLPRTSE